MANTHGVNPDENVANEDTKEHPSRPRTSVEAIVKVGSEYSTEHHDL
jgi:hypothetical protein